MGGRAWGFQSREPVGERRCRAHLSVGVGCRDGQDGSGGLEVLGSLVYLAHSPTSVALFAPTPVCSSERAVKGVCPVGG